MGVVLVMVDRFVKCSVCDADVNYLDLFPNDRCLVCHAVECDKQSPAEVLGIILDAFGGRRG